MEALGRAEREGEGRTAHLMEADGQEAKQARQAKKEGEETGRRGNGGGRGGEIERWVRGKRGKEIRRLGIQCFEKEDERRGGREKKAGEKDI